MKKALTIAIIFLIYSNIFYAQSDTEIISKTPFNIGETIEFPSEILDENRKLNVYLPLGYSPDSAETYPVIYLLDGSEDEDFIHVAGLVQFGSFSWINMIPETIVIGIANVDRKRDFTYPTNNEQDKIDFPTTGGSQKFISFLEKELIPLVNKQYKTSDTKTIIGQSLGGLLSTEILFKKPELFDNYIIVSPSLWWDDESLLKTKPRSFSSVKSIYISVGKEGEIMERTAQELHKFIQPLTNESTDTFFNFLEKQNHGDALHLSVYDAFERIFRLKEE